MARDLMTLVPCRFLPSEDLGDSEQAEAEGGPEEEEILFVFQRVAEQEQEEEVEEAVEEEEEQQVGTGSWCGGLQWHWSHVFQAVAKD